MPTYLNKRTGTKTITGPNGPKDRVARRRPDLYQRVDNTTEPPTPDGQVVEKMAADNQRTKQTTTKPADTEQPESGRQPKQTRPKSAKPTEQGDTATAKE